MKSYRAGKTSEVGVRWWSVGPGPAAGPGDSGGFAQGTLQAARRSGQPTPLDPPLGWELLDAEVTPPLLCSWLPNLAVSVSAKAFLTVQQRPGVTKRNYIRSHGGVHLILL